MAVIIFFQIAIIYYQLNCNNPTPIPDSKIISAIMDSVIKIPVDSSVEARDRITEEKVITRFNFDPNLLDQKSWLKLGLSEKQINVIQNYISKGGKFRIKNDLKKMYCISKDEFEKLEPFILLPDSFEKRKSRSEKN